MGGFRELHLETGYDSDSDDIIDDFYIPVLSRTVYYDRLSGFFRSSSFAISAKGLDRLIENKGKMRIICSPMMDEKDVEILRNYSDDPVKFNEYVSKCLDNKLDSDFFDSDYTEALGWMLAKDLLEIRIVVMKKYNGDMMTAEEIDDSGIFHSKVGIFKDEEGQIITFSGSINETISGWTTNIEEFKVFCSWWDGQQYYKDDQKKFEKYWNVGKHIRSETLKLPDAIKQSWIKTVPSDYQQLRIFKKKKKFKLRKYQKDAISNWVDNGYKGIFNMATGTGKTLTSILAAKDLISKCDQKVVLIVAVPFQHLIKNPWYPSLREHLLQDAEKDVIIEAFGDSKKWNSIGIQYLPDYYVGIINSVTFITTYDTLFTEKFTDLVDRFKGKRLLIADEVHNAGADIYRTGLRSEYDYRLGLSATPGRYLDDEGTSYLFDYFDKEVYTFSLEEAMTTINPDTGLTFLTPYKYHPIFVSLTDDELQKYAEKTRRISMAIPDPDSPTPYELERYHKLLVERSRIIKNANEKLEKFITLIPEFKEQGIFDHCLVYCSDGKDTEDRTLKTIQRVIRELNANGVSNNRFTSEEDIDQRTVILDDFSSGNVSTLVAIKCLDEGVDVPATRNAIIMASTGNPREYIQRRGRILRRFKGKDYAELYDFVVVPRNNNATKDEKQILLSEYKRYKEFSDLSMNRKENELIITKLLDKYQIDEVRE